MMSESQADATNRCDSRGLSRQPDYELGERGEGIVVCRDSDQLLFRSHLFGSLFRGDSQKFGGFDPQTSQLFAVGFVLLSLK